MSSFVNHLSWHRPSHAGKALESMQSLSLSVVGMRPVLLDLFLICNRVSSCACFHCPHLAGNSSDKLCTFCCCSYPFLSKQLEMHLEAKVWKEMYRVIGSVSSGFTSYPNWYLVFQVENLINQTGQFSIFGSIYRITLRHSLCAAFSLFQQAETQRCTWRLIPSLQITKTYEPHVKAECVGAEWHNNMLHEDSL